MESIGRETMHLDGALSGRVEPDEEFDITFHVHDTADSILDSEVILDKFVFLKEATPGTVPIE